MSRLWLTIWYHTWYILSICHISYEMYLHIIYSHAIIICYTHYSKDTLLVASIIWYNLWISHKSNGIGMDNTYDCTVGLTKQYLLDYTQQIPSSKLKKLRTWWEIQASPSLFLGSTKPNHLQKFTMTERSLEIISYRVYTKVHKTPIWVMFSWWLY